MADATETEEVKYTEIVLDGKTIRLRADSKVFGLVEKAELEQKESQFKETRELVRDAVLKVAMQQMDGYEDSVEGMAVIVRFDSGTADIIEEPKIKLAKRMPKKSE